jgi:hypothetical protein
MVKRLTAIGDRLGLIIDRPILDRPHIDKDTPQELTIEGAALVIRPAAHRHSRRVGAAAERLMKAHATMLRRLAGDS